jgi:hypothetical protein
LFGRKKSAEEWCEKGVAFCELGKYGKGFGCFDKVKKIESNDKIYKK